MRPILDIEHELGFYQIGESWYFAARIFDADLGQDADEPSAATITITNAGNGAIVGPVAMTVDGPAVSYTLSSGAITTPGRNLKATITLTIGGETHSLLHVFDAVRFSPRMTVTTGDLVRHAGQAASLKVQGDETNVEILKSAWEDVLKFVGNLAGYPDGVINSASLKRLHLFRTLELLFGRATMQDNGANDLQRERWAAEWKDAKASAHLAIDADDSGTLGPGEEARAPSSVAFGRRQVDHTGYRS